MQNGISFEVKAVVTFSESWYLCDSKRVYVMCRVVYLFHILIRTDLLIEFMRKEFQRKRESILNLVC